MKHRRHGRHDSICIRRTARPHHRCYPELFLGRLLNYKFM